MITYFFSECVVDAVPKLTREDLSYTSKSNVSNLFNPD